MPNYLNRKVNNSSIESHSTAAWAEIKEQYGDGNVPMPSFDNVVEAKEWVEINKKQTIKNRGILT